MAEKIKVKTMREDVIEAARKVWAIAAESPEMGNALMDTIGGDAYERVMWIVRRAEVEERLSQQ
jgi:hypothetical protein